MNLSQGNYFKDQLTLEYCGSSVESGCMNSYDVALYIMAFSDFGGIISKEAFGEVIKIKTDIRGFRGNSFDIDFALQILFVTGSLLTSIVIQRCTKNLSKD